MTLSDFDEYTKLLELNDYYLNTNNNGLTILEKIN